MPLPAHLDPSGPRSRGKAWRDPRVLFSVAVACSVVYGAALTWAGLAKLSSNTSGRPVVEEFSGISPARLIANVSYVLLMVVYVAWLAVPKRRRQTFVELLKPVFIFILIAYATLPLSSDVFQYFQYGLMVLRRVNPYITRAQDVPSEILPLVGWPGATSVYGPASLLLFAAPAHLLAIGIAPALYAFKIICTALHVANGYLVWRLLRADPHSEPLAQNVALAYLLNPLLLSQQVADAHLDVLLNTAFLALAGYLRARRYLGGLLALGFALCVKILAILWAPILCILLARRRAWKALGLGALAMALVGLLLGLTLFQTAAAWMSLLPLNPGTARSVHHVVRLLLDLTLSSPEGRQRVLALVRLGMSLGFVAFYGWVLWRGHTRVEDREDDALVDMGVTTLVLMLLATPWMMPWYPGILLAILPFTIRHSRFTLASFTFCLSTGLVVGGGAGRGAISIATALTTIVPPALVLALRRRADALDLAGFLSGEGPGRTGVEPKNGGAGRLDAGFPSSRVRRTKS